MLLHIAADDAAIDLHQTVVPVFTQQIGDHPLRIGTGVHRHQGIGIDSYQGGLGVKFFRDLMPGVFQVTTFFFIVFTPHRSLQLAFIAGLGQATELIDAHHLVFFHGRQQFPQTLPVLQLQVNLGEHFHHVGITGGFRLPGQFHQGGQALFPMTALVLQPRLGQAHRRIGALGAFMGQSQVVVPLIVLALLVGRLGGGQVVDQRQIVTPGGLGQPLFGIGPVPLGQGDQAVGGEAGMIATE